MSTRGGFDFVVLAEEREMIEHGDILRISEGIHSLLTSDRESAKNYKGKVALSIDGYDDDPRELYQIPEVRRWFARLDEEIPYMMYFLSEQANMPLLYVAMFVPFEKKEGGLSFDSQFLVAFLERKCQAIIDFCRLIGDDPMPIIVGLADKFGLQLL